MSKSDNVPMMYSRFPAVAALNQVQGFDPLKLLRRMVSTKTGEEVLRLDLQYKKLWFRLKHPEGRVRLKPLRITEQLAIYEAQVYLNREDQMPVCSFTSSISKAEAPDGKYIQAAQNDAVDNALTDAGFGIQLSDVATPESKRNHGSEIPVSVLESAETKDEEKPVQSVRQTVVQMPVAPEQTVPASQVKTDETTADTTVAQTAEPAIVTAPVQIVEPATENAVETAARMEKKAQSEPHEARAALEVLRSDTVVSEANVSAETSDDKDLPFTMRPQYNNDMSVEEIVKVMTLEQAREVVVDDGMSKGMKMGEVAQKRPASLKFYVFGGYRKNNNILKAAAQIVYDQLQKAG